MTPAERKLVTELFDRLATLEDAQRDPDAERAIRDGLAQAPNAIYALVQTALVQDEALKSAHARIQELEGQLGSGNAERSGGFLDNARGSIWGRREEKGGSIWGREEPRGSVPNVRPGEAPMGAPPQFGGPGQYPPGQGQYPGQQGGPYQGQPMGGPGYPPQGQMPPPEPGRGGGSFLGTAAAAAVGAIGGSLLMNSLRGMGGGGRSGQAMADTGHGGGGLPWGRSGGGDELSRSAGLDDIGRSSGSAPLGQSQGQGAFGSAGGDRGGDTAAHDDSNVEDENYEDDNEDDSYDGGDSDTGEE